MKFIAAPQGTPEWLQARAGAITASCFAEAVSVLLRNSGEKKAGDPTAASDKYAGDVAIERISGKPYGEPPRAWVLERGHIMEAAARVVYETRFGLIAQESGIVKTDDDWFGYSTDGLVDDDGLIEIKCPVDSNKIMAMFNTGDTSEYDHQIQGGMWITGRQWCDFLMYVPDLETVGNDLYVKRIYRDEQFIEKLETDLMKFRARVQMTEAMLRRPIAAHQMQAKKAA
ncbi:MAG: YqaJ viral recombinase family protein [Rhodocyclaceae bacterium]|nr:YqaJ viral recombinase family protein [Rhodocyclaceae bacterium]